MVEVECGSVDEFLNELNPLNPHWGGALFPEWVFRGQEDAKWDLQCSSWRPGALRSIEAAIEEGDFGRKINDFLKRCKGHPLLWEKEPGDAGRCVIRAAAEHELVCRFTYLCDQAGLNLPHDRPMNGREFLERAMLQGAGCNYLVSYTPSVHFQLAQHHGIPTKLLDWTLNPLIAAYFAMRGGKPRGDRAVFALRASALVHPGEARFVRYGRSTIPNMHAQAGAFTFTQCPWITHQGCHLSLESILALREDTRSALIKFRLPAQCVEEVRDRLVASGLTRAHLHPSYATVSEVILEDLANPSFTLLRP